MPYFFQRLVLLFFLLSSTTYQLSYAAVAPTSPVNESAITLSNFVNTSNKELERKYQVDLSFKEKLVLFLIKKKLKKTMKEYPALANFQVHTISKDAGCDTIILKDGRKIIANIHDFGRKEIRYRKCDENGTAFELLALSLQEVYTVTKADGKLLFLNSGKGYKNELKRDFLADVSLYSSILGVLSLFVASSLTFAVPIILLSIGILAGFTSLFRINADNDIYRGKGAAIAGIIISFLPVIGFFILLQGFSA